MQKRGWPNILQRISSSSFLHPDPTCQGDGATLADVGVSLIHHSTRLLGRAVSVWPTGGPQCHVQSPLLQERHHPKLWMQERFPKTEWAGLYGLSRKLLEQQLSVHKQLPWQLKRASYTSTWRTERATDHGHAEINTVCVPGEPCRSLQGAPSLETWRHQENLPLRGRTDSSLHVYSRIQGSTERSCYQHLQDSVWGDKVDASPAHVCRWKRTPSISG